MAQTTEQPPGGAAAVGDEILRGGKIPSITDSMPNAQQQARAAARFLVREQVYEGAEQARLYLDCLKSAVAADDGPGIAYAYRKFAAHGRVIAAGCKELASSGEGAA
jgi:hypothetical protein